MQRLRAKLPWLNAKAPTGTNSGWGFRRYCVYSVLCRAANYIGCAGQGAQLIGSGLRDEPLRSHRPDWANRPPNYPAAFVSLFDCWAMSAFAYACDRAGYEGREASIRLVISHAVCVRAPPVGSRLAKSLNLQKWGGEGLSIAGAFVRYIRFVVACLQHRRRRR